METKIKLLKDLSRMCQSTSCLRCPIQHFKSEGSMLSCVAILGKHPEEIISAVEKWVQTHPEKTILDDVKEKYPLIGLDQEGIPEICPKVLGYVTEMDCKCIDCKECWKQPLNK